VAASEPQIFCYAHRPSATRFITGGNESRWAEPPADADAPAASIILFRRKTSH
jgi:hypothetical protein